MNKADPTADNEADKISREFDFNRTVLAVGSEAYAAFLARLDEAPKPNERLRRTVGTVPLWE